MQPTTRRKPRADLEKTSLHMRGSDSEQHPKPDRENARKGSDERNGHIATQAKKRPIMRVTWSQAPQTCPATGARARSSPPRTACPPESAPAPARPAAGRRSACRSAAPATPCARSRRRWPGGRDPDGRDGPAARTPRLGKALKAGCGPVARLSGGARQDSLGHHHSRKIAAHVAPRLTHAGLRSPLPFDSRKFCTHASTPWIDA